MRQRAKIEKNMINIMLNFFRYLMVQNRRIKKSL